MLLNETLDLGLKLIMIIFWLMFGIFVIILMIKAFRLMDELFELVEKKLRGKKKNGNNR